MFYHEEDREQAKEMYELLLQNEACDQSNKQMLMDEMTRLTQEVKELKEGVIILRDAINSIPNFLFDHMSHVTKPNKEPVINKTKKKN